MTLATLKLETRPALDVTQRASFAHASQAGPCIGHAGLDTS